jgi:hypothetical protein
LGWETLSSKLKDNKGLDGVFVKRDKNGLVENIEIVETKFSSNSLGRLSEGQMEVKAIDRQIKALWDQGGEYQKTFDLIQNNRDKVELKFKSVNKDGIITDLSDKLPETKLPQLLKKE